VLEELLNEGRNFGEGDAFVDFAGDGLGVIDAATENDVVSFDFFARGKLDGGGHHADVTDVVLGAGVMAAGEVDVEGLVKGDFFVEVVGEEDRLAFGVGGGVFAAGVAGAGDESSGDGGGGVGESGGFDRGLGVGEFFVRDVWDDEVLPGGEADLAGAKLFGEVGDGHHGVDGHTTDGNDDAEVVAAVVLLVGAEVAMFDLGPGLGAEGFVEVAKRESQFLLNFFEELGSAPVVDEILKAGFLTIGAVAVFDEDAEDGGGEGGGFAGGNEEAGVGGELFVTGDAAELDAEVDSGVEVGGGFVEGDGVEGDVVGVGAD